MMAVVSCKQWYRWQWAVVMAIGAAAFILPPQGCSLLLSKWVRTALCPPTPAHSKIENHWLEC